MKKKVSPPFSLLRNCLRLRYLFVITVLLIGVVIWQALQPPPWWQFALGEQITQQPVPFRDSVILATNHGTITAIDQRSGKVRWEYQRAKEIFSQPTIKHGKLFVAYNDSVIVALNPNDGSLSWQHAIPNGSTIHGNVLITETKFIYGDAEGNVRGLSLRTGEVAWSLSTPQPESVDQLLTKDGLQWFGYILMDRGELYIVRTHGLVFSVNPDNGKVRWEQKVAGTLVADPLITRTSILLSTNAVSLASIQRQNGELTVATKTENASQVYCQIEFSQKGALTDLLERTKQLRPKKNLVYETERSQQIVQIDTTGKLVSYRRSNLEPIWQLELGYQPKRCFYDQKEGLYVTSAEGKLTKVALSTQKISWEKQFAQKLLSISSIQKPQTLNKQRYNPDYYTEYLFVTDENETLYRLKSSTGEINWQFQTDGSVYIGPTLLHGRLFIVSTNGGLYRLLATNGKPDQPTLFQPKVQVDANTNSVEQSQIYELQLRSPSNRYANPHTAVAIQAEFKNQEGRVIPIQGFFYDTNEWRIRFNPPTAGKWEWTATWGDAFGTQHLSGQFESQRAHTYLHPAPDAPKWLTKDNQTITSLVGINDCITDRNFDGSPLNDFYIGDDSYKVATIAGEVPQTLRFNTKLVPLTTFLDTYRTGFNTFRQGVSNCSPFLSYPGDIISSKFLIPEGKQHDELSRQLYEKDYIVWFTMFGFSLPFGEDLTYPDEKFAIEKYVQYVVARYGAYVDIWEISNEAVASDKYVQRIAEYIQKYDPYQRLISVSWEKPALKEITLISPHWYQSELDSESDLATVAQIDKFKTYQKPVIFGEQGNQIKNWDETSADRMRVRIWTAFFNQASLIFWNQSNDRNFYNPTYQNSNLFLGEVERGYAGTFLQLTKDLALDLQPTKGETQGTVRSYQLQNQSTVLTYFFNSAVAEKKNILTTNTLNTSARYEWFDTRTGELLSSGEVERNAAISSPLFSVDIFLKVTALQ